MTQSVTVVGPPARPQVRGGLFRIVGVPEAMVGLGLLVVVLAVTIIGPLVAPYSPTELATGPPLSGPSAAHLLGTDELGRDVLSRLLNGGGSVILIPLIGVILAMAVGAPLGFVSGYAGGKLDAVVTRILDVLLSIPPLLMVLVIVAGFGTDNSVLVISIVLVSAPQIARVIRGATQNLRPREFVLVAEMRGENLPWIVGREIAPNMFPTLCVEVSVRLTYAILFVATLSFLGLGVQPPIPNWGLMVSDGQNFIASNPVMAFAPAAAIAILVVGIHLVADAVSTAYGIDERRGHGN